ncbi:MAG: protein kinase [Acidobacteria bacterium]|nr:protein kinase [Acidobacteriota bacterium]
MSGEGKTEPSPDPYWERIRELFHAASELPRGERDAYLREHCPDDKQRAEVLSLLASADSAEAFLEPAPRAQRTFAAGELVAGRYIITGLLGAGGMGEVYEAEDRELRETVALKIIRPEIASNARILERFRREIQLARRVTHPNVCRIYDVSHHLARSEAGELERRIIFVSMELLHGRTLASELRERGRMSAHEAWPIVRQMAAGLDAAHAASIVHRDFKSANVMLVSGSTGLRAVITDFGLAHETDTEDTRLTASGMMVGTPDYMAPEQIESGPISPATDVYALGVVLFEMVTRRLPFAGTTPLAVALQRLQEPATSPRKWVPDLDARWEAVILRCLERDPSKRFDSAGAVVAALEAKSPLPHVRRRGARVAGATIVVIAALGGVALPFLLRRHNAPAVIQPKAPVAATPAVARRTVAVLGFRSLSSRPEDAWLSNAVPELLTTELSAAETLRLISGDDVARMKDDLRLRDGDAIARSGLEQIRDRVAADVVLTGTCVKAANDLRVDVRLQDTRSGDLLATLTESGNEGELFALVSRLGKQLRAQLGAVPLSAEATAGLRASMPKNAEAARAYVEGLTKLRRFDALGARESLERAVAAEPSYAMAHAALAEALWNLGFEDRARAAADRALALSADLGREERLSIEARASVFRREFDKAIETYRSLLTFYPDELAYGVRLAVTQVAAGKAKDALATIEKLRMLPKPVRDDPAIDLVAADAYQLTHESEKELSVAQRAEAVGAATNMRGIVARAKANQSYAYRDTGRVDLAVSMLREAAQIYEEMGDRAAAARCYSNLGLALWNQGDLAEAEPLLERALVMHRQLGSRSFESRTLNNLGIIRFSRGNIDGAEKVWREAVEVQRESNFLSAMAPTLNNLGGTRQLRGDFAQAAKYYSEAISVSQQTDDRFGEVIGTINTAELLRLRGDLVTAAAVYDRGLKMARELSVTQNEAYVLAAMGELAAWRDDFALAHERYAAALALREKMKDRVSVAQSQGMLANLALEENKPAEADRLLGEAIAVFAKEGAAEEEAAAQETLARSALLQSKIADADRAMTRAKTLTKSSLTLALLAAIDATDARLSLAKGDADAAATQAKRAVTLATQSHVLATELEARLVSATIMQRAGHTVDARAERARVAEIAKQHGLLLIARKAR